MKKSGLIIITIIVLVALFGILLLRAGKPTGNVIAGDVFEGIITNMNLQPQVLDGKGVYDKSCLAVDSGLTQCDAGIQTEKGLLNFNYKHNMHAQKCIDDGDNLRVEILEGGKAIVTRI